MVLNTEPKSYFHFSLLWSQAVFARGEGKSALMSSPSPLPYGGDVCFWKAKEKMAVRILMPVCWLMIQIEHRLRDLKDSVRKREKQRPTPWTILPDLSSEYSRIFGITSI